MILVLYSAVLYDIYAKLHKLVDVLAKCTRIGSYAMLREIPGNVGERCRVIFVGGLPEKLEDYQRSVGNGIISSPYRH